MRKLIVPLFAVALYFVANGATAATLNYRLLIDGTEASMHVLGAGTYGLEVQAMVTENDVAGNPGGLLQSAFNLSDSAGAIVWTDTQGGFLGGPDGLWDSTAPAVFTSHFQGTLVNDGKEIVAETGAIAPGSFTAQFNAVGAGVWSTVAEGTFDYNGSMTTLELSLAPADVLVAGLNTAGTGIAGRNPEVVMGASTVLGIPEPTSLVLSSICLGALALRRRRIG